MRTSRQPSTDALDPDMQLLIGGDNGLRGYPLRYEAGTSRALLTVEQRFYTDWYPFGWCGSAARCSRTSAGPGGGVWATATRAC